MAQAPERMRFRGLRLIIDGEGRQPYGGPLALSARITRRSSRQSLAGQEPRSPTDPAPVAGA